MKIDKLFLSNKTVFTPSDVSLLLHTDRKQTISNFLQRMKIKWILRLLRPGIWVFAQYNSYELWVKLKKGSYVSCETILREAGLVFQYYGNTVTLVSDNSVNKRVDGLSFVYRKISDRIRLSQEGLIHEKTYTKASPERALCDMIYLSPSWYCDDLSSLDWQLAQKIASIYPQRVLLQLNSLKNASHRYT